MSLSFRSTPQHLHLLPVITSTATIMFFSMECLTIKSFLSPLVPASTISAFWKAYTFNSSQLGIRYAYNTLSAISGMMCYYSLRKTRAGVKEFYAIGVVFSLMHFAFEPWVSWCH
jgi:hypothetical protein